MPQGCRLQLNLINKDLVSVVKFVSIDQIIILLCGD
jgi:hypothetical protein